MKDEYIESLRAEVERLKAEVHQAKEAGARSAFEMKYRRDCQFRTTLSENQKDEIMARIIDAEMNEWRKREEQKQDE